jgi:hypothetical protein
VRFARRVRGQALRVTHSMDSRVGRLDRVNRSGRGYVPTRQAVMVAGTVPCPSPGAFAEFIIGRRFAPARWLSLRPLPAKERGEVEDGALPAKERGEVENSGFRDL